MSALLAYLVHVLATMQPLALAAAAFATGVILTATFALILSAERSRRYNHREPGFVLRQYLRSEAGAALRVAADAERRKRA